ncbi:sigma-70 family RNA polymerase sigma factor [Saccharopolyspora sp. NPDC047091]|uniref:RNA polymerase sigma factor n=1 Tax=Saccharopolyspora sp. NPDC047091 TaxID=3155924 RepID=UPI0033C994B4
MARSRCATREDAEDAAQEALLILHRRLGALRTATALGAWLARVVGRECLRLARRTLRAAPAEGPPVGDRAVEDVVLGRHGDLAAALAGLPVQDREILLLRDVLDRSGDDTAAELGLTRAAMKSRLLRARGRLRRALLG